MPRRRYSEASSVLGDAIAAGADGLETRAALAEHNLEASAAWFMQVAPQDVESPEQRTSRLLQESEQREYIERSIVPQVEGDIGDTLRPRSDWSEIDAALSSPRSAIVLDDFLSDEALISLREDLLRRKIWRGATARGEVITTLEHGFALPVVLRLADELRRRLPTSVGSEPLTEAWAYHYRGWDDCTHAHGDAGRFSANIWMTPDEFNESESGRGGLRLWTDRGFVKAGTLTTHGPQLIADMSDLRHDADLVVPYRSNRAVIFDALTVHETDAFRFRPAFENRRMNATLLFGWPGLRSNQ